MFGYHVDMPRIPGRPLGCCKRCRQRARWQTPGMPGVCTRCGLPNNAVQRIRRVRKFIVFEDEQGNVLTRVRAR